MFILLTQIEMHNKIIDSKFTQRSLNPTFYYDKQKDTQDNCLLFTHHTIEYRTQTIL